VTIEGIAGCAAYALGAALYIAVIVAIVERIAGGRLR